MGVPSFYRWLSKKYPKCVVYVKEDPHVQVNGVKVPIDTSQPNPNEVEFDNLYLDMNGIIHPAAHPEDGPAPTTEDDMYIAIFEYIDRVFACVRPRKLLFMAIDGVAPRAKMNQQRSRRFRAAQEREEMMQKAQELRDDLRSRGLQVPPAPKEEPFDSNVITPGTPFMARLAIYLRWFIRYKIENDSGWRNIKVILSDASIPGEGEHKIMDYIRLQRAHEGHDPNTRHVIHGLDADLIMLALATHDPHFFILREEVTFGKSDDPKKKAMEELERAQIASAEKGPQAVKEEEVQLLKPFQFIKLSVLREYLHKEFCQVDFRAAGGYNLERVIDDFILMCFFVGNDFLPHLPSMEIREGAIDTILDLYKTIFNELGGWMTCDGEIRMKAVQTMMKELGTIENEVFGKRKANEDRFEQRQKQKKIDSENRQGSKDHLELIRRLTTDVAAYAIPLGRGETGKKLEINDNSDGPSTKRPKLSYDSHAPTAAASIIPSEAFRIKNRTVGGRRLLAPGTNDRDARLLHTLDKIREFAERNNQTERMKLEDLNGFERAKAHAYCDELELKHPTKGTDPNRYIEVQHKPKEATDGEGQTAEDAKENFDALLKAKMMKENDKIAEEMLEKDPVRLGEHGWKKSYYETKVPHDHPNDLARCYLEGLVWVMKYYYKGCQSWNWFYPFHYAPFASDLANVEVSDHPFSLGKPFLPFEQLMAVFPPASSHALPKPLAALMNEDSVIGEFYPSKFQLDLNGKKRLWQAVVLLPFIEEQKLLSTIKPIEDQLVGEERERNQHKYTHLFAHKSNRISEQLADAPQKIDLPNPPSTDLMNGLLAAKLKAELAEDQDELKKVNDKIEETRKAARAYLLAVKSGSGMKLDPNLSMGMNGTVFEDPESSKVGQLFKAPEFYGSNRSHPYKPEDLVSNTVHCVIYDFPEFRPHKTTLLPGLTMPEPALVDIDYPQGETNFIRVRKGHPMMSMPSQFQRPQFGAPATRMVTHNMGRPPPRHDGRQGRVYGQDGYQVGRMGQYDNYSQHRYPQNNDYPPQRSNQWGHQGQGPSFGTPRPQQGQGRYNRQNDYQQPPPPNPHYNSGYRR